MLDETLLHNRLLIFSQGDGWFLSYRRLKIGQNFVSSRIVHTKEIVAQPFFHHLFWSFQDKKEENLGFLLSCLFIKFDDLKLTYLGLSKNFHFLKTCECERGVKDHVFRQAPEY